MLCHVHDDINDINAPRAVTEPRRHVDLSPRALLAAGVSGVLAADMLAAESGRWTLAARGEDLSPSSNRVLGEGGKSPLAIVTVRGPLDQRSSFQPCEGWTDGYDAIEARFAAAAQTVARAGAGEVQLHVDSPGGIVAGGFSAMRRMRALADRLGVRVSAVADENAGSMGYALMLVADKGRVHVPLRGRTASIGTVIIRKPSEDAKGAEIIRSGERKMRPNGIEPLDEQDRADLQAIVDQGAEDFAAWVAERRGLKAADVLALKGASMSGEAARAAGLIDGNLNAQEVIEMAQTQASLDAIAGALGLSAGASEDEIKARATEARAALDALPTVRAQVAAAEGKALALEEAARKVTAEQERARVEQEAAAKRSTFAQEVRAHVVAGKVSPAGEAKLMGSEGKPGHYDRHGEASARDTLAAMLEQGPLLTGAGGGKGSTPKVGAGAQLTEEQKAHAKAIGATEDEYAAAVLAGNGGAS